MRWTKPASKQSMLSWTSTATRLADILAISLIWNALGLRLVVTHLQVCRHER